MKLAPSDRRLEIDRDVGRAVGSVKSHFYAASWKMSEVSSPVEGKDVRSSVCVWCSSVPSLTGVCVCICIAKCVW